MCSMSRTLRNSGTEVKKKYKDKKQKTITK